LVLEILKIWRNCIVAKMVNLKKLFTREKIHLLSEVEIVGLRDWIDFQIGENYVIQGKIIPSTPIPSADGYAVISWKDKNQDIVIKHSSFYPVERIKERKERGWTPYGREDFALRQLPSEIYMLHPKGLSSLSFFILELMIIGTMLKD
jgi:hypothetical protein